MSRESADDGLSVPRPTRTPAARSRATGATPQPSSAFERGQCATAAPVAASAAISSSPTCTAWATTVSGPEQPALGELQDRMAPEGSDEAREHAGAADQRIQLVARLAEVRDDAHLARAGARDNLAEQRQADREGRVRRDRELDARPGVGRERVDPPLEVVCDGHHVGVVAPEGLDRDDGPQASGRARPHRRAVVGRIDERRHARAQALGGAEPRHGSEPVGPEHGGAPRVGRIQGPNASPSPRPA